MEIEQYYREKANIGKADEYRKGIAIFHIGQGDIELFPQLKTADSLWLYKNNGYQLIYVASIRKYHPRFDTLLCKI